MESLELISKLILNNNEYIESRCLRGSERVVSRLDAHDSRDRRIIMADMLAWLIQLANSQRLEHFHICILFNI